MTSTRFGFVVSVRSAPKEAAEKVNRQKSSGQAVTSLAVSFYGGGFWLRREVQLSEVHHCAEVRRMDAVRLSANTRTFIRVKYLMHKLKLHDASASPLLSVLHLSVQNVHICCLGVDTRELLGEVSETFSLSSLVQRKSRNFLI